MRHFFLYWYLGFFLFCFWYKRTTFEDWNQYVSKSQSKVIFWVFRKYMHSMIATIRMLYCIYVFIRPLSACGSYLTLLFFLWRYFELVYLANIFDHPVGKHAWSGCAKAFRTGSIKLENHRRRLCNIVRSIAGAPLGGSVTVTMWLSLSVYPGNLLISPLRACLSLSWPSPTLAKLF